ncbi:MAG: hypothetical protein EBY35_03580 [Rhodobacteraceae bacterium]|nr:hypothetical protein [Paracoccaceae bacterium]
MRESVISISVSQLFFFFCTSIVRIMQRFYDVANGQVTQVADNCGVVTQTSLKGDPKLHVSAPKNIIKTTRFDLRLF